MGVETRKKRLLLHMKKNKEKEKKNVVCCRIVGPNRSFFNFFWRNCIYFFNSFAMAFYFLFSEDFLDKKFENAEIVYTFLVTCSLLKQLLYPF